MGRLFDPLDRRIVALALPALGALVAEPLYNLTDSAIVGHLGKVPLGGLAIATTSLDVLSWAVAFVEMATISSISFRRSAGDESGAGKAAGAAYLVSLLIGLAATTVVELAAPVLAGLIGGDHGGPPEQAAVTYLRIAAVGLPALFVALAGAAHLTGLANTKRPLVVALISNVANVVLEVVLVYLVHLGIAGSAWGTVAAQLLSAGLFIGLSNKAAVTARLPKRADVRALLRNAAPLTVRTVALGAALLVSTAVAARLGGGPLAGHQIAMQVWYALALVLDSLAVPAQVFVSDALGAKRPELARRVGRRTLLMGIVFGSVLGVATMASCGALPIVFTSDGGVRHQATVALFYCGLQQPLAAGAFVLDGLVLGAADYGAMRRAMLLALFAFAPLISLTLAFPAIGLAGVWLALFCWLAARSALLARSWRLVVSPRASYSSADG